MIYIILSITVLVTTAVLTEFIRRQAIKKSILDIPNHRSSHSVPTPRGGGLAVALTWYITLFILFFIGYIETRLFLALVSGLVLSVVSFIDDIKNLSAKVRFVAQAISAIAALIALGGLAKLDLGFYTVENTVLLSLLAIPFIVWFINLFNFLDGIDGYLGMETICVIGGLWFFTSNIVLLVFIFAMLGFLVWNWPAPKAKIFCGDVGSTLVGFNLAIFAIYFQNTQQLSIIVPVILGSVFVYDASITLIRRWRNGEKISEAHRKHAYQRIVQYGFSHAKTVYLAMGVNAVLFSIAYIIYKIPSLTSWGLGAAILMLWGVMRLVDSKKRFS